jgi:hypothetical protein
MASQVFSGPSNFSYTNNMGQNVRVVINYMGRAEIPIVNNPRLTLNWSGVSVSSSNILAIGRNLAHYAYSKRTSDPTTGGEDNSALSVSVAMLANNTLFNIPSGTGNRSQSDALPTEIMLSTGQTFSAICGVYNVVIIPENG